MPLILGGGSTNTLAWTHAGEAFLALSLLASVTCLHKDLRDLQEHRRHWPKHRRPLAGDELSVSPTVASTVICTCVAARAIVERQRNGMLLVIGSAAAIAGRARIFTMAPAWGDSRVSSKGSRPS